MQSASPSSVDPVEHTLERYRRFMHTLSAERGRRGDDPWSECPLTLAQLRALALIAASQHGLNNRQLAENLNVGASAVTPLVDRLVERGFVLRQEDEHDRRVARLHATESGALVLDRMNTVKDDLMREILGQLEPDDLRTVSAALDLLRLTLERYVITTPSSTHIHSPEGSPL